MTTKVELITTAIAEEILEKHNPRNRTISEDRVSVYATDMKNKRWTLTHQGIAFDENGDLIDGQHRLWAVVFSGMEIEFNVTRGIPIQQIKNGIIINSMDNIDTGRSRGAGSQMTLSHGIKNGNQVAACLRGIASMISPTDGRKRMSTANTLFLYEQYGKDAEVIIGNMGNGQRVSHLVSPLTIYHHGQPDKAVAFCEQMRTLENMTSATRYATKFLECGHSRGDAEKTFRIISKCIYQFHEGKDFKAMQDDSSGIKFLLSMHPSLNKRIADAIKPVAKLKIPRKIGQ